MQHKRVFCLGGCIVLAILTGLITLGTIYYARIPDFITQLPLNTAPVMITLSYPLNNTHYPVNSYIPVRAKAVGDGPALIFELWVDGALIESQTAQPDTSGKMETEWHWVPDGVGEHILLVRAQTSPGEIATSNLVRVTATEAVSSSFQIAASEGDTLGSLAERLQMPLEQIHAATWSEEIGGWSLIRFPDSGQTPESDPATPLVPGQPILIPFTLAPPPSPAQTSQPAIPSGPTQPVDDLDPGQFDLGQIGVWLGGILQLGAESPTAPLLAAEANGCEVHLFITDQSQNEQGFLVYQGGAGGTSLQRITVLAENNGTLPLEYVAPGQPGNTVYVVAAFNAAGEIPSTPVSVQIEGAACSDTATEPGGLQWDGNDLLLPQTVDLVYFYLSPDGEIWDRVPPDPEGFLVPVENRLEVDAALDSTTEEPGDAYSTAGSVRLEAWGWQNDALVYLGNTHKDFPSTPSTSLAVCATGCYGDRTTYLRLTEYSIDVDNPDKEKYFEWSTQAPVMDRIVWQVSESPFPPGPVLLESAFTWEEEVTNHQTSDQRVFSIDFGQDFQSSTSATDAITSTAPENGFSLALDYGIAFSTIGPQHLPRKSYTPPQTFYVRAIPFAGNQPAAEPSNTVIIHIEPYQQSDVELAKSGTPLYDVRIVEFRPLYFGDPGVCPNALILETDWVWSVSTPFDSIADLTQKRCIESGGYYDPNNQTCTFFAGARLCPASYDEDDRAWYEVIWDLVEGAVNWVADLYESIKQTIVDAVGSVICGGDELCKDGLMIGLNAGLAAMGIPPSIPNLDQIMEEGVDYLAAEVATQVTGTDAVQALLELTPDELAGLAEEEIERRVREKVKEKIQNGLAASRNPNPACMSEEEAHARGMEPLCLPPGVSAHWDTSGMRQPASITVEVTRRPLGASPPSAATLDNQWLIVNFYVPENAARIGEMVDIDGITGYTDAGYMEITDPLRGHLFENIYLHIPPVEPGESMTITFIPEPTDYWVPGHEEALGGSYYQECYEGSCQYTHNDWWLLYYDAEVQVTATIDPCYSTGFAPVDYWSGVSYAEICNLVQAQCLTGPMPHFREPYTPYCGP